MSLFLFIFLELMVAFLVFALLSKKFEIKFDIMQVVIHIIVIVSISISRVTGFLSEAISVDLAHLYSKEKVKENHYVYPSAGMNRMLTLWTFEIISFSVYFCFLVWLLLVIESVGKKTKDEKKKK